MSSLRNPFRVAQPFQMSTDELNKYWVQHHFYENLLRAEHCFVFGPPGIGKSMLTRHLMPDVQLSDSSNGADFYGVNIPLRSKSFTQGSWKSLDGHPNEFPLSEHILATYVLRCLIEQFLDPRYSTNSAISPDSLVWRSALDMSVEGMAPGLRRLLAYIEPDDSDAPLRSWLRHIKQLYAEGHESAKKCRSNRSLVTLGHVLVSFDDVTEILTSLLRQKAVLASRFYLLFDDVDDLTTGQALALNYWIAQRLHHVAVIKCNSEGRYATYRTMTERRIRDPHDYYQINLASVYTRDTVNNYESFLETIVNRRLKLFGYSATAGTYFPGDERQAEAVTKIAEAIKAEHPPSTKTYAPTDRAYRIAESEYLKDLRRRKQLSTYRYAGFRVLADISSNVVRHFLTSASDMFTETDVEARGDNIPVNVQHTVLKRHAEELIFNELKQLRDDETDPQRKRELEGLERLVLGVGMKCKVRLFSDLTERRVFSFAFQDTPSIRLQAVLDAGIQHGFFQVGSLSDKEGMIRRRLYVLTRRVAPFFSLLVRSYSGYISLKASELEKMLDMPIAQLRAYCKDPVDSDEPDVPDELSSYQSEFDYSAEEAIGPCD